MNNVIVKARHLEVTDAIRDYVEAKAAKLPRYFDQIINIEAILDMEADQPLVELIIQASHSKTFVAKHRDEDMYAAIDQCLDKMEKQLRRHKDKLRNHQTQSHPHAVEAEAGEA